MKIAIVAPGDEKVPPAKYGGTELVIYNLAEGLVEQGHEVHLFASGDSETSAILHPTVPKAFRTLIKDKSSAEADELRWFYNSVVLGRAAAEIAEMGVDIVHNHLGWRMMPFAKILKAPVVTTFHGPYDIPFAPEFLEQYPNSRFVSISNSQARMNAELPFAGMVYNGIRVDKFAFNDTPQDYVAFLGRITPDKGIKGAIEAAKEAGTRLVIGAKVDAVDRQYYETEIKPLIDGKQIQYLGEVDHAEKVELLRNAKALLMLIEWEEPFGLVMAEALACGTPVIGIPRGSVPELVEDGKTGFIVHSSSEAAAAIQRVGEINRQLCRQTAERKFSARAMVQGYLDVYHKVLVGDRAALFASSLPLSTPLTPTVQRPRVTMSTAKLSR